MDHVGGASSPRLGDDPDAIQYTNDYVRRLLAEAVYVYAKIENPGGSVILTASGLIDADRTYEYSSRIGNPFHLDLISLRQMMDKVLSKGEKDALLAWANGLTPKQAAIYLQSTGALKLTKGDALRKRRERGINALTESFNEEEEDTGRVREDSQLSAGAFSEGAEHTTRNIASSPRDTEREKNEADR